jgi:hypothetical protein
MLPLTFTFSLGMLTIPFPFSLDVLPVLLIIIHLIGTFNMPVGHFGLMLDVISLMPSQGPGQVHCSNFLIIYFFNS